MAALMIGRTLLLGLAVAGMMPSCRRCGEPDRRGSNRARRRRRAVLLAGGGGGVVGW